MFIENDELPSFICTMQYALSQDNGDEIFI